MIRKYKTPYKANSNYQFDKNKYDVIFDQKNIVEKLSLKQKHACSSIILLLADGSYGTCIGDGCEYYEMD